MDSDYDIDEDETENISLDESDLDDEQLTVELKKNYLDEDENDENPDIDDNEELQDDDDEDDNDEENDIVEEQIEKEIENINLLKKQSFYKNKKSSIRTIKRENANSFSKIGMYNFLCNLVTFIKKGGLMLDGRTEFDYPNITEESYAIQSILLNTTPFECFLGGKKINIPLKERIILLKLILRPVDMNKTIFFTNSFTENFPLFCKNLFKNTITEDEINEIKKNKYYHKIE